MKHKNMTRWLALPLVLLVMAGLFLPGTASANPDTAVNVTPPSQTVSPGSTFSVDIYVTPDTAIAGVQFDLSFDPSLVTADSVTEGNLLNQGGASTYFVPGTIDNVNGTITDVVGAIITGGATVSSPGTLTTISFTAGTEAGTSPLDLDNVIVGDIRGHAVTTAVTDGNATVGGVATHPIIAFSPSSLSFSAIEAGPSPGGQTLEIWNSGVGTLDWEVSEGVDWLSLSPGSGSSSGEKDVVTVSVDISGVTAGDYDAAITISMPETSRTASVELHLGVPEELPEEPPEEPPEVPPGLPAGFSVSELHISPEQVQPNQEVEISISVSNAGAETGSYTAALYINGDVEDSRTVSIPPDSTQSVVFEVTKSEPRTYQVSLEGLEGQFTVVAPGPISPGTLSLGRLAIAGIIGVAIGAIPPIVPIVLLVLAGSK